MSYSRVCFLFSAYQGQDEMERQQSFAHARAACEWIDRVTRELPKQLAVTRQEEDFFSTFNEHGYSTITKFPTVDIQAR